MSGNGQWKGIIYAPHAALSFSGNEIGYGALGADTITFSGNTKLHYDEALQIPGIIFGAGFPYQVIAWKEVVPFTSSPPVAPY